MSTRDRPRKPSRKQRRRERRQAQRLGITILELRRRQEADR